MLIGAHELCKTRNMMPLVSKNGCTTLFVFFYIFTKLITYPCVVSECNKRGEKNSSHAKTFCAPLIFIEKA